MRYLFFGRYSLLLIASTTIFLTFGFVSLNVLSQNNDIQDKIETQKVSSTKESNEVLVSSQEIDPNNTDTQLQKSITLKTDESEIERNIDTEILSQSDSDLEVNNNPTLTGVVQYLELSNGENDLILSTNQGIIKINARENLYKSLAELEGFLIEVSGVLIDNEDSEFRVSNYVVLDSNLEVERKEISKQIESDTYNQKMILLLCEYNDQPNINVSTSWFQNRLDGPGIESSDSYWNDISQGRIRFQDGDVAGWYQLPNSESFYEGNIYKLYDDCVAEADDDIDFTDYTGIAINVNGSIDGNAAGIGTVGFGHFLLENTTVYTSIAWFADFGWDDSFVWQHEFGHNFGLPHSSAPGEEYGSWWDVMSSGYQYLGNLGALPTGTIAYHYEQLGLLNQEDILTVGTADVTQNFRLNDVYQYNSTENAYGMARVMIDENRYYSLEARKFTGYDQYLPEEGVLIHEINPNRKNWAVVADIQGDNNVNNSGSVLDVGEMYVDSANNIVIKVLASDEVGYEVMVTDMLPDIELDIENSLNKRGGYYRLVVGEEGWVTASVVDHDGFVDRVDFYQDGNLLSSDSNAPYSFDTSNLAKGDYDFYAIAFDNDSNAALTNTYNLTVADAEYSTTLENGMKIVYDHRLGELIIEGEHKYNDSCSKMQGIKLGTIEMRTSITTLYDNPSVGDQLCKYGVGTQNYSYVFDKVYYHFTLQFFDDLFTTI